MELKLYNTLSRQVEVFRPGDPQRVTLYVCGPTVYNYPHIGNARPAVVFDVLYRLLRHTYPAVVYARNITDLDDKINAAAQEQGVAIRVITDRFAQVYHEDMQALGVLPPDREPRATEHVPAMLSAIERLLASGHAYVAEGHVLFDTHAYAEYGRLSRRDRDEMIAGARVEVAPYKKDPADFVLWKPSSEDLPGWPSPWGRGRPGWHLECSTMIQVHLGDTVDIHGGGQDLIFPHHENEIAQGTCASGGKLFCRYWLHNGFVSVNEQKMSKSLGNVLLVRDLLKQAPGEVIRLALLSAHYRSPMSWTDETLAQAAQALDRLYRALEACAPVAVERSAWRVSEGMFAALADDLNTPQALAELHRLAHEANKADAGQRAAAKAQLLGSAALLGLLQHDAESWFRNQRPSALDEPVIESLLQQRNQARRQKDFATADKIRRQLQEQGVAIEDHAGGTRWRRVH